MPSSRRSLPFPFVFVILVPCFFIARSQDLHFSFPSFSPQEQPSFSFNLDGSIQGDALQLTQISASITTATVNSTGRITYSQPLKLWSPNYNYTATFNTTFLLSMEPMTINGATSSNTITTGGGMAFILCSQTASESQVANSYGEWLGLFNGSTVAAPPDSVDQLVAIEFDTFKDSFDPDNNHVGIDLNSSLVSVSIVSLAPSGISLRTNSTGTIVWVDYDGRSKQLNVFVNTETKALKPTQPTLSYSVDLSLYLPQNIYLGFAGSTGTQIETHSVRAWNFTSDGLPSPPPPRPNVGLIVGLIVAVSVVSLPLIVFILVKCRRSRQPAVSQGWLNFSYGPREFAYKELIKATDNFSNDRLLGEGGFGAVYAGTLADPNKSAVAVKRISAKSRQGEREFIAEVTTIGRLRHRNLVQLLGWCQDRKGKPLLVYEYMPNGSLDRWLHRGGERGQVTELGWERRYTVMKGLAAGLLYLHEEWEMVVVHRDLKPSNVMLDAEYNARLGDFGLARLIEAGGKDAETRHIAGTPGYMAPEYLETGLVSKEADMYSFGAVAIEVASGCRPSFHLRRRLWQLHEQNRLSEAADPRLAAFELAEMERLLLVGLACCHPDPPSRPTIGEVLHSLSSLSSTFIVPPPPPGFLFSELEPLADSSPFKFSSSSPPATIAVMSSSVLLAR